MNKCLVCFYEIDDSKDYHPKCAKRLFESTTPFVLDFGLAELKELAIKAVATQTNITGAQAKISLTPVLGDGGIGRLSVVYKGKFILKPASDMYPQIPEVEALTMQMAEEVNVDVVSHGLIKMDDGSLAYLTRRMDRVGDGKVHQEDICQLSERLTEDKYRSSCERVGKVIIKHALYPKIAIVDYFKIVIFNFIHGNNDMHMKNYSMTYQLAGMKLTPAYDLLNINLLLPEDKEESALTLNGKKSRLKKHDFDALAATLEIQESKRDNVYKQLIKAEADFNKAIDRSFLTNEFKEKYKTLVAKRLQEFK